MFVKTAAVAAAVEMTAVVVDAIDLVLEIAAPVVAVAFAWVEPWRIKRKST